MSERPTNSFDAEARIQELLTQAMGLLKEAKGLANDWDLSFSFLGENFRSDYRDLEDRDFDIGTWRASWSPGC